MQMLPFAGLADVLVVFYEVHCSEDFSLVLVDNYIFCIAIWEQFAVQPSSECFSQSL
jgi:hypothetical protein